MGWPVIFMAKRGSEIFWGLKGAPKNVHNKYFLYQVPLTSVCERSLMFASNCIIIHHYQVYCIMLSSLETTIKPIIQNSGTVGHVHDNSVIQLLLYYVIHLQVKCHDQCLVVFWCNWSGRPGYGGLYYDAAHWWIHREITCMPHTQDNSGIPHLIPRHHLPEWREEHEWAFVHCGNSPGGYSTLSWVRMCGPKFRPPPYNKTREDANLLPI